MSGSGVVRFGDFELDSEANRGSRQEILIRELGTQCNHQNGNLPQLPWLKAL